MKPSHLLSFKRKLTKAMPASYIRYRFAGVKADHRLTYTQRNIKALSLVFYWTSNGAFIWPSARVGEG